MTGGDKLQAYLSGIDQKLATAGANPHVSVGFLEGAVNRKGVSIPFYMAMNEFGTAHIPPRPFFRNMIRAKGPTWGGDVAKLLKATSFDAYKTLATMGQVIQGQLRRSINETNDPPNAASTIARKGASKPLIDTRDAWKSVDYEVQSE